MTGAIAARWHELTPLLDRLLELDATQRAAFLRDEIVDAELRALLVELLRGESSAGFLDGDAQVYAASLIDADAPIVAALDQIGPYRLVRLLGEGGSGSVYLAERDADGYVQRVALKLLRVGLRDASEQERFRRERRILARLEHPHIARLLDGGFTAEGVPWFALEFVEGEPVTRWCDARALDVDSRLRLFLAVCAAVAAAHRALIVHRDLKPANILVGTDGAPKLLDFGIARLLDDTERDDDTRTGQRRLTPAYAAPEQFDGGAITTATDVYALGVLLQELLCGVRPRRDGAARPMSVQFSAAADADALATARSTRARALRARLDGDLDTIVACALAPDPQRRYAGVTALAADIERTLAQRPIHARAPSAVYRAGKFLRRHRLGAVAAVLLAASIVAGIAATLHETRRAQAAALQASVAATRAAAVKDFVLALFAGVTPDESRGRAISARELVERGEARLGETLASHPELDAELSTALAAAYRQLGDYERAANLLARARGVAADADLQANVLTELGRVNAAQAKFDAAEEVLRAALALPAGAEALGEARVRLAELLAETGKPDAARALLDAALAAPRPPGANDAALRRDLAALGGVRFAAGDVAGAEADLRRAYALALDAHGATHTESARLAHDLAIVLLQRGGTAEAAELLRGARATRRALLGARHPDLAQTTFNLAVATQRLGDAAQAESLYTEALEQQRAVLGERHPDVASSLNSLAVLAYGQGDVALAIERQQAALAVARMAYGAQHPTVATMLGNLAGIERAAGRLADAERDQRDALAVAQAALGTKHYLVGVARISLASVLAERNRIAEARQNYVDGLANLDASLGPKHLDTAQARAAYAELLLEAGEVDAARRDADAALAAVDASLPAGHPRRLKLQLVQLRTLAATDCVSTLAALPALREALAAGGNALRADRASATLLAATCFARTHSDAERDAALVDADAMLAGLHYVPRRLRQERAALQR